MNAQSNSLESMFAKSGIPYRIIGGLRFYERKEIKDVIAYLCVLANPGDHLRLKRIINVPKRGIGDATVNGLEQIALAENKNILEVALHAASYPSLGRASSKLTQFAEMMFELRTGIHTLPIGVFVEKVLEKTGYLAALAELDQAEAKDRTANVKELVSNAVNYANTTPDATLEAFLEEVALVADIDNYDSSAPATVMMTVHSAKGLEFPVVFLTGMEEGVFPGSQTIGSSDEEMEEERRLCFVAMTRAEKKLYLSEAAGRDFDGAPRYPSRFLLDIDETLLDFTEPPREGLIADARAYISVREGLLTDKEPTVYQSGMRVKHSIFGFGTILDTDVQKGTNLILFDDMPTARQISYRAKLEILGLLPTEDIDKLMEELEKSEKI